MMNPKNLIRHLLLGWLIVIASGAASAHKASDSYLQIDAGERGLTLRWDIALRDLDAALDIDSDQDGRLTWGEVDRAWPQLQRHALSRLQIAGCPLRATGRALEKRNDGAYAVLMLASDCVLTGAPVISYSLLRDIDATHRGIAKVQRAGQPMAVTMLDPAAATASVPPSTQATAAATPPPPTASEPLAITGAWGFVREGIHHILSGYDHVMFLLCLLLPSVMRRTPDGWRPVDKLSQAVWPVVGIVSAFTVAHSITLGLAATKVLSLSPAFIEPAIALTVILAALDNVWPIFPVRRVVVTFCFGLIHGFGFAGVLAELNLPTSAFALALLEFNVGLEAGQLMIVLGATTLLFLLRGSPGYRPGLVRGGSFAAMLVGTLWLIERVANVSLLPSLQ
jgi:hypothetical protein